ncbi:MAG: PilZ domain-containing protein [Sphingomicrobium sp.]
MASRSNDVGQRPREWRRRVSLPARVRNGTGWSNGHILKISSRGMLLRYGGPLNVGCLIELRRDEHGMLATVVWRERLRAGLSSSNLLPVAELIPPEAAASLEASSKASAHKLHSSSLHGNEGSRLFGRRLEFIVFVAIAAMIATSISVMAAMVLFKPLASAVAVL